MTTQTAHVEKVIIPGDAYAAESAAIRDAAEEIGVYLAVWSMRDDSKPDAQARQMANCAMDAIDTALRELHELRARLVSDIRRSDDAATSNADPVAEARLTEHQKFLIRAHYGQDIDMEQVQADLSAGNCDYDFEGMEKDYGPGPGLGATIRGGTPRKPDITVRRWTGRQ